MSPGDATPSALPARSCSRSYTTLIEDPEETIHRVLQFLGGDPDVASAVGVVEPSLRSQHQAPYESTHLKDDEIQLFDDFVGTIESRSPKRFSTG